MKKIVLLILALFCLKGVPALADEGMWVPALIQSRIKDMKAKGFKLTAEDIYSINRSSLKDAVLLFGSGCTGEVISDEGLFLTNHHCGYYFIGSHSSVEHDYLTNGLLGDEPLRRVAESGADRVVPDPHGRCDRPCIERGRR